MKFISDFIAVECGEGIRRGSVLLQQISGERETVLFACVCEGEGWTDNENGPDGYAVMRLQDWYREEAAHLSLSGCSDSRILKSLSSCLEHLTQELFSYSEKKKVNLDLSITGILLCGSRFWLFHRGAATGAYLMNQYFLRPHIRCLTGSAQGDVSVQEGFLQSGTGILLCTYTLYDFVPDRVMRDCLSPEQISRDIQVSKRLGELAEEAQRRGSDAYIGAVYIKLEGRLDGYSEQG